MTLQTFLSSLKTSEVKITIIDNEEELIKFYSEGYAGIESDVLARTVKKWYIVTATSIKVILESV